MATDKMTRSTSAPIPHGVVGDDRPGEPYENRVPLARDLVFPDKVKIRPADQISLDVLSSLGRPRVEVDDDGVVLREYAYDHNLYVGNNQSGSLISGSLRNWADAVGLAPMATPFGPSECGVVLNALALKYGLSVAAVRSARLSYLEVACDLPVPRPVAEYARTLGDMSRATTHRSGTTTVRYETTDWELTAYRKSPGVLRVEMRYKSPAALFGRRLRAGQLADPTFRDDLARRWVARARSLPVRRLPRPDRRAVTYLDRVRQYALKAMEEAGGLDVALDAVRADREAGRIKPGPMRSQIRDLRALWADATLTREADVAAELAASIDAVEALLSAPPPPTTPTPTAPSYG